MTNNPLIAAQSPACVEMIGLPRDALVFPVGGIRPDTMAAYWAVGANGFGTGSNLYTPGADAERVRRVAAEFAAAFAALPMR